MKQFYVTLCRELSGHCIHAEAPSKDILQHYIIEHYGKIWCSITEKKPSERVIGHMIFLEDGNVETLP
jgi:hypothetical protein